MKTNVKIEGKLVGLKEDKVLIDSPKNIKIMAKYYSKMLTVAVGEDQENEDDIITPMVESSLKITETVLQALTELLNLTKAESQKLEELSFSPMLNIFNELLRVCLGIDMGVNTAEENEENEDPKLEPEKRSNS